MYHLRGAVWNIVSTATKKAGLIQCISYWTRTPVLKGAWVISVRTLKVNPWGPSGTRMIRPTLLKGAWVISVRTLKVYPWGPSGTRLIRPTLL